MKTPERPSIIEIKPLIPKEHVFENINRSHLLAVYAFSDDQELDKKIKKTLPSCRAPHL